MSATSRRLFARKRCFSLGCLLLGGLFLSACGPDLPTLSYPKGVPRSAQSLALSADGTRLAVVNPDADSVSIVDPIARTLLREVQLGTRPMPTSEGRFEPLHGPRSVELSPDGRRAYIACQWSGLLLTINTDTGELLSSMDVGKEPVSVLAHTTERALFVAVYQSAQVLRIPLDDAGLPLASAVVRQNTTDRPFGLALDGAATSLYVSRFLTQPGIDRLDAQTLAPVAAMALPEISARANPLVANGAPRGLYSVAVRPRPDAMLPAEVWTGHLLLNVTTAQPMLTFETSVFPAISIWSGQKNAFATLSTDSRLPGIDGQIADVVSGPRALAFTPDGRYALVVNMSSEDLLLLDADKQVQVGLLRPLPGDLPEGIVVAPDGLHAYIDQRASNDLAVVALTPQGADNRPTLMLEGTPIARLAAQDPMPRELRLGQRLFYSANSSEFPLTKNFWVACASCHLEGRSDAVTWRFAQGPRDTPTNAGGTQGTGFLLRNAGRNRLSQYDETIQLEQGGDLHEERPADLQWLQALSAYVDRAIPFAKSPTRTPDGKLTDEAIAGQAVFARLGCPRCHLGPRYTDSGDGNPTLDLGGPVLLHNVGTCATGVHPDQPVKAENGAQRPACEFDTPTLNDLFDTAPYFHDGSAPTLDAVLDHKLRFFSLPAPSPQDRQRLLTFLRSL